MSKRPTVDEKYAQNICDSLTSKNSWMGNIDDLNAE